MHYFCYVEDTALLLIPLLKVCNIDLLLSFMFADFVACFLLASLVCCLLLCWIIDILGCLVVSCCQTEGTAVCFESFDTKLLNIDWVCFMCCHVNFDAHPFILSFFKIFPNFIHCFFGIFC